MKTSGATDLLKALSLLQTSAKTFATVSEDYGRLVCRSTLRLIAKDFGIKYAYLVEQYEPLVVQDLAPPPPDPMSEGDGACQAQLRNNEQCTAVARFFGYCYRHRDLGIRQHARAMRLEAYMQDRSLSDPLQCTWSRRETPVHVMSRQLSSPSVYEACGF
jgi:hypothetical protein